MKLMPSRVHLLEAAEVLESKFPLPVINRYARADRYPSPRAGYRDARSREGVASGFQTLTFSVALWGRWRLSDLRFLSELNEFVQVSTHVNSSLAAFLWESRQSYL